MNCFNLGNFSIYGKVNKFLEVKKKLTYGLVKQSHDLVVKFMYLHFNSNIASIFFVRWIFLRD